MADVHGSVSEGFEGVRKAFAANLDQGLDVGASACVMIVGITARALWRGP